MIKIGLTGCIGSGKSASFLCFKKLGALTIDADDLVSESLMPGGEIFKKIVSFYGGSIVCKGFIDKRFLRSIIFSKYNKGIWIESLIHKYIRGLLVNRLEKIYRLGIKNNYLLVSIPLLPNLINQYRLFNRICVVDAGIMARINRVCLRNKVEYDYVKCIIKKQSSREKYLKLADDIIINNSNSFGDSHRNLKSQVYRLHRKYLKTLKKALI